ncbi:rhoptry neck protein 6, partial [Reticulomyxa filosa]
IKIKTYEKEELEFKIKDLKDDGTMLIKNKDRIWEDLLEFIGDELNLSEKSRFILVNANNENDQIEDADELCEHWNDFANGKMEDCIFNMRCLVIKRKKRVWTWYPKGANDPNFQNYLNKQDWDGHLEDLMKMIKVLDEECLKDKKEKILKSGDGLKKIWSDRYGDEQSCSFVLNIVEKEKETEEESDNENKKKKTKGNTEEEGEEEEDNKHDNIKQDKKRKRKSESENRVTDDDKKNENGSESGNEKSKKLELKRKGKTLTTVTSQLETEIKIKIITPRRRR